MTPTTPPPANPETPDRCPRCDSPAPHLHPAVQFDGEVNPCPDSFHFRDTPQNRPYLVYAPKEAAAVPRAAAPAPEPPCADCGAPLNAGEAKTFTVCDACWDKAYPKPAAPAPEPPLTRFEALVWLKYTDREGQRWTTPQTHAEVYLAADVDRLLGRLRAERDEANARLDAILNKSVPADYRPVSFAALCDSLDSKQLEADVYELLIWHLRRAEQAEAAVTRLTQEREKLKDFGWFAFCEEHREKTDDMCPRCEADTLRGQRDEERELAKQYGATNLSLEFDNANLRNGLTALRERLREHEWSGTNFAFLAQHPACSVCGGFKDRWEGYQHGHRDTCWLAALLACAQERP